MANSRRYRDDDAWRALRFEVCVACRSRLCRECEMVAVTQERDGDTSDAAAAQHLHLCLACSTRLPSAHSRRPGALLHSNSLQDDRLLSRPGTEYRERGGHTTSAKAIFDDSEDFRSHRQPKADSESGSRRGRRRLPSESALSSLIASTRASFDAWRRRKKVSAPALIPVPPPTATVAGAAIFSHELSHSVDATTIDSRSNSTSDSDMELSTIDLRTRRRRQQRRPTSTSIDYSFSTSELELSTVDLRQARDCKRRPSASVSSDYSSSDSEMDLPTVDLRRARDFKRRPSNSMPDVLPRNRQGGSGRGGDAALRHATAMTPSRPDPLSISYVKHYK